MSAAAEPSVMTLGSRLERRAAFSAPEVSLVAGFHVSSRESARASFAGSGWATARRWTAPLDSTRSTMHHDPSRGSADRRTISRIALRSSAIARSRPADARNFARPSAAAARLAASRSRRAPSSSRSATASCRSLASSLTSKLWLSIDHSEGGTTLAGIGDAGSPYRCGFRVYALVSGATESIGCPWKGQRGVLAATGSSDGDISRTIRSPPEDGRQETARTPVRDPRN